MALSTCAASSVYLWEEESGPNSLGTPCFSLSKNLVNEDLLGVFDLDRNFGTIDRGETVVRVESSRVVDKKKEKRGWKRFCGLVKSSI